MNHPDAVRALFIKISAIMTLVPLLCSLSAIAWVAYRSFKFTRKLIRSS